MKSVIVIPARFSSTRLPGKPLMDIHGKPMIVRVCESIDTNVFAQIAVATDHQDIVKNVEAAGYQAILTKSDHVSGTDRLQEAATKLGLNNDDIIINLQGDEPLMPSENLQQVCDLLVENPDASVATLYELEQRIPAQNNPNMVKLVQANNEQVLYFSRAGIPFDRDDLEQGDGVIKRHVGVYAYRKLALDKFVSYNEGPLERLEKLEQLRFMENGHKIIAAKSNFPIPVGVDTAEDLEQVREVFATSMRR